MRSRASGLVLEVEGKIIDPGSPVVTAQHTTDSTLRTRQHFYVDEITGTIRNVLRNYCIEVHGQLVIGTELTVNMFIRTELTVNKITASELVVSKITSSVLIVNKVTASVLIVSKVTSSRLIINKITASMLILNKVTASVLIV